MKLMVELNQLKKQQNRKNMKCKVASKVIAASMAVAMVITMAGCGSSGKKVEATKIDVTFDQIEVRKDYTDIKADLKFLTHKTDRRVPETIPECKLQIWKSDIWNPIHGECTGNCLQLLLVFPSNGRHEKASKMYLKYVSFVV